MNHTLLRRMGFVGTEEVINIKLQANLNLKSPRSMFKVILCFLVNY